MEPEFSGVGSIILTIFYHPEHPDSNPQRRHPPSTLQKLSRPAMHGQKWGYPFLYFQRIYDIPHPFTSRPPSPFKKILDKPGRPI